MTLCVWAVCRSTFDLMTLPLSPAGVPSPAAEAVPGPAPSLTLSGPPSPSHPSFFRHFSTPMYTNPYVHVHVYNNVYSKTSNSGLSEKRTISVQRTSFVPPIDIPIELIHKEPPRSGHLGTSQLRTTDTDRGPN